MSRACFRSARRQPNYFRYDPAPHTSCNGGQLCQDQLQTFGMTAANINSQLSGTPVAANEAGCAASETSEAYALDAGGAGVFAVLSADLEGNIIACNEAVLKMFACTAAEVLGRTLDVFIEGEHRAEAIKLQENMLGAVHKQGQYRCSVRCQTSAEKHFTADLSVTLLRDGRSVPTGMVAMLSVADEKL